jgi:hypothetical protein
LPITCIRNLGISVGMTRTQGGILLIELLMSVPMYDESNEKCDRRVFFAREKWLT